MKLMTSLKRRENPLRYYRSSAYAAHINAGKYFISHSLADYKQWEFVRCLELWIPEGFSVGLKTDLFEDAFGYRGSRENLVSRGSFVIGMDVSETVLQRAGSCASNQKTSVSADMARMPFKTESINVIFSPATLCYLEDMPQALREAYRVLTPGGTMVAVMMNPSNIFFRSISFLSSLFRYQRVPQYRLYSWREFSKALEANGFIVAERAPVGHFFPGVNFLFSMVEQSENRILKKVSKQLLKGLKIYSTSSWTVKYWTAWYIMVKLSKRRG